MSKSKKVTPNVDQQSTQVHNLNLTVLQRRDPFIDEILFTVAHVTLYVFNIQTNQWSRKDVEGSLFVVKRNAHPCFQFIVMNRRNADNLVENLVDFEYEVNNPYILYRNAAQEVNGIWFYNPDECEEVANLFNRLLNTYKMPPPSAIMPPPSEIMPSSKSEFEGPDPISITTESPLGSSSAAASTTNAPEDSALTNFFRVAKAPGNFAPNVENFRQPYHSANVISSAPSGSLSSAPDLQLPSASQPASSISGFPLHTVETSNSGNQVANLIKPSTFFVPHSSPSPLIPPAASPAPPNAALHHSLASPAPPNAALHHSMHLPHPYGAPILQSLPPPNPPPSLASSNTPNRPVISRDKVRGAFLSLVQDDQFIDMVFQTLRKLNL